MNKSPIIKPDFSVVQKKISIFPEAMSSDMIYGLIEGESAVFISVGPGETHVTVLDNEGEAIASWTAVFGWSSLCDIALVDGSKTISLEDKTMVIRALQGSLKIYGERIATASYIKSAQAHMKSALSYIMEKTVGDAKEYDRIVLAAAPWVHVALERCLELRPHIDQEIQVL